MEVREDKSRRIQEFIKRRFPFDCRWTTGNCYWFAIILCEAFQLELYYLEIENHFLAKDEDQNSYYDWTGQVFTENAIRWKNLLERDPLLCSHITRDCIM